MRRFRFTALKQDGKHVKVRVTSVTEDGKGYTLGFLIFDEGEWEEFEKHYDAPNTIEVADQRF